MSCQSKNISNSEDVEYSEGNDLVPYETPLKYKPQIRQRTHDLKRNLPKAKELQVAVVGHVVGKLLRSPINVYDNEENYAAPFARSL